MSKTVRTHTQHATHNKGQHSITQLDSKQHTPKVALKKWTNPMSVGGQLPSKAGTHPQGEKRILPVRRVPASKFREKNKNKKKHRIPTRRQTPALLVRKQTTSETPHLAPFDKKRTNNENKKKRDARDALARSLSPKKGGP